jgi:hypothetical protein
VGLTRFAGLPEHLGQPHLGEALGGARSRSTSPPDAAQGVVPVVKEALTLDKCKGHRVGAARAVLALAVLQP